MIVVTPRHHDGVLEFMLTGVDTNDIRRDITLVNFTSEAIMDNITCSHPLNKILIGKEE